MGTIQNSLSTGSSVNAPIKRTHRSIIFVSTGPEIISYSKATSFKNLPMS